jgi:hypothetical protein
MNNKENIAIYRINARFYGNVHKRWTRKKPNVRHAWLRTKVRYTRRSGVDQAEAYMQYAEH